MLSKLHTHMQGTSTEIEGQIRASVSISMYVHSSDFSFGANNVNDTLDSVKVSKTPHLLSLYVASPPPPETTSYLGIHAPGSLSGSEKYTLLSQLVQIVRAIR